MSHDNKKEPEISEEDFRTLNESMVQQKLHTPDHYYIDLRLCKDLTLGAILSDLHRKRDQLDAPAIYATLIERMDAYQKRLFDDTRLFDDLGYGTERVTEILNDPTLAVETLMHAPATPFIKVLEAHIITNANHSQLKERFTKVRIDQDRYHRLWDSICFHINIYPLQLDAAGKAYIAAFFSDRFGVDTEIVSIAPFEMSGAFFDKIEEGYFYRLDQVIESPEVQDALRPLKNIKKYFFAAGLFDPKVERWFPAASIPQQARKIKAELNMFITFEWLSPQRYGAFPQLIK